MRLAVSGEPTDETLAFGRQIGATEFVGSPGLCIERGYYRYQDLLLLRNRVQDAGLRYDVAIMPEAMRLSKEVGYDGPFVYDHVPEMVGDSERQEQAVAFALGYMKGLMKAAGVEG